MPLNKETKPMKLFYFLFQVQHRFKLMSICLNALNDSFSLSLILPVHGCSEEFAHKIDNSSIELLNFPEV